MRYDKCRETLRDINRHRNRDILREFLDGKRRPEDLFDGKKVPKDSSRGKGTSGFNKIAQDIDAIKTVRTHPFPSQFATKTLLVFKQKRIRICIKENGVR